MYLLSKILKNEDGMTVDELLTHVQEIAKISQDQDKVVIEMAERFGAFDNRLGEIEKLLEPINNNNVIGRIKRLESKLDYLNKAIINRWGSELLEEIDNRKEPK